MGESMNKADSIRILKAFQIYRRGAFKMQWLLNQGITPNLIGQALDVAIEDLELKEYFGDPKKDRVSNYPIVSQNGKHAR